MDKIHLGLKQMGLLLVVTPILLSMVLNGCLALLIIDAENGLDEQMKSTALAMRLHETEQILADAFCKIVSHLPTDDPQFEVECDSLLKEMESGKDEFRYWRNQRIIEKKTFDELEELMDQSAGLIKRAKAVFKDKTIKPSNRHKHLDAEMRSLLFRGESLVTELSVFEENVKLNIRQLLFNKGSVLWILLYGGLFLITVLCVSLVFVFSRYINNRLMVVHKNAELLAIGKPVVDELEGDDELSNLNQILIESSSTLEKVKEKELAVLANTSEVLCSLDSSLRFTTVGSASQKLWGYKESDLVASPIANIVAPADRDRVVKQFQDLISKKKESSFGFRIKHSNGEQVYTNWTVNWNQETKKLYCVARDVTERVELEKLKTRFLSSVSHDLRTPLSSIMHSFNLVIDRKEISPKIKSALERGKVSINRLLRLVEELLEIDKLESGKLTVEPGFVSSYDACTEAIEAVEWFAKKQEITIDHNLEDLGLSGDEKRIIQVLVNLLSNAIKFSPKESTIFVTISKSKNFGVFKIKDQGPGISKDEIETIFERYSQAQSSGKGSIKGTGLGLAICSAIVKAHGGEIGVDSEKDQGSTFWFQIPLFEDESNMVNGHG